MNIQKNNKRRLKILHVLIGADFGGATIVVRTLSRHQMALGHDVSVLANNVRKNKEELNKYGIRLVDDKGIRGNISLLFDVFHLFYWICLMKKNDFDIVHTQTVKAGIIGRLAAKLAGIKYIIHSGQGYRLEGKFKSKITEKIYISLERLLSIITNKVIVPSMADYNTALENRMVPESKLKVIYNGLDVSGYEKKDALTKRKQFREEIGVDEDEIVIATVGRLNKAKGHVYLIEAIKKISKKHLKMKIVFIGDGPEKNNLEEKIKISGLVKNFIFLNYRNDIPTIMQGIDMHILPSVREGFGIVLLEAMAAGKPCIATDVGGPAEVVIDGVTGFVVKPGDADMLAAKIEDLISDIPLMETLGRNGYERMKSEFTAEVMGKNIQDVYESCIQHSAIKRSFS